jgi:hypothetical protein
MPDIEMRGIGKGRGATASEAAALVAATISTRIAQRVLSDVELLRKSGVEGAREALKSLIR